MDKTWTLSDDGEVLNNPNSKPTQKDIPHLAINIEN
jgi:hypothetical protein